MLSEPYHAFLFAFVAYGAIYLITESVIGMPARLLFAPRWEWLELWLYCAYCVGIWFGFVAELTYQVAAAHALTWQGFGSSILTALFIAGSIAIIRAFAPSFLSSAHEREADLVQRLREKRQGCRRKA